MVVLTKYFSDSHPKMIFIAVMALLLTFCATTVSAVTTEPNVRKTMRVKAAFIFQMSKFVNWSINKQAPLVFCMFPDPRPYNVIVVLQGLEKQGKLVSQGHRVITRIIENEDKNDIQSYDQCSLIYFNNNVDNQLPAALYKKLGKTKLTIGSNIGFVEKGGLTALVYERGKHKLYIHRDNYESSLVKIRSRLLSLAKFYPK